MTMNFFKRKQKEDGKDQSDFIEIETGAKQNNSKVMVKTFVLKTYDDITPILNTLREGYSIAVIDIKSLKSKDVVELKRVVSKIKKTVEAIEGSIAGFGDNVIIATPSFAKVQKGSVDETQSETSSPKEGFVEKF